jgi:pyruvate dehydrogenase E2 component (dihydrolipoamide acetyltransferase)
MLHRVFLPQLGQTMEEGTVERWHKREGESIKKGEVLFDLTTDKATLEVEATASGVVKKILVAEGQAVPVNELIAVIGDEEDQVTEEFLAAERPAPAAGAAIVSPAAAVQPAVQAAAPVQASAPFASPRARKVAAELKVPLAALRGSGPGGRIVESDVLAYADKLGGVRLTPAARAHAYVQGISLLDLAGTVTGRRITKEDVLSAARAGAARRPREAAPGQRIALTPMRRTIAERMAAAKQTVPHFYLVGDVMMRPALDMLRQAGAASGEKITVTALLVKAVAAALREHPRLNARFDGDAVALNATCNVGVAVAVQDGLFVPVIKRADQKGLADVSAELRSLAETARAGKLIPEQYEGGSVTISNLGMYGVDYFLPIINPPESCIIGVGAIREQPVVRAGGIAVEPVVKVSVSADHRVVDGVQAGKFFRTLKGLLEDPRRLAQ